ncbi:Uncharacterised protein [Mycobacterium tuberculosis]|uniref:Uncharacterized protein n=1 Tax=Mycobacterium tuberculosis TaxID=1773 RepID=A0A654TC46_MYCTX|nr:Uncharacterised protein [Mycobacterium tuberculosis]CKS78966.1 Uncharacterised protein [Mycobacterium tuberculosis]CNM88781.1 Uncharacterised protein [Mycobacterium tuberculosis]CNN14281.1 Uncharacterised protein [Mycobacterium tuberculosis]CNV03052.1 Uncharacterised protein [Mycobacterium tuberculosis]
MIAPLPRSAVSTIATTWANTVAASAFCISARVEYTIGAGPKASQAFGCWLCGSHFSQSQCARLRSLTTPAISNSSGECHTASWQIIARSSPRTLVGSPSMAIGPPTRKGIAMGASAMVACAARKQRSAARVTGSARCAGGSCPTTKRVASGADPTPTRMRQKSAAPGRRSHIRGPPINVHKVAGSGCVQFSDTCCAAAVWVTDVRKTLRYPR